MLAEPDPGRGNAFLSGIYHYARGVALVGKNRLDDAAKELAAVKAVLTEPSLDGTLFSPNIARAVLSIAPEVLGGEIALGRRQFDQAIAHFDRAVRLEDALVYTEPSEWHYPPRQALGRALQLAGRFAEAETVFWEDLKRNPENGWSLRGVIEALRAQNKMEQAAVVEARLKKAWARSDVRAKLP